MVAVDGGSGGSGSLLISFVSKIYKLKNTNKKGREREREKKEDVGRTFVPPCCYSTALPCGCFYWDP